MICILQCNTGTIQYCDDLLSVNIVNCDDFHKISLTSFNDDFLLINYNTRSRESASCKFNY